MSDQKPQPNGCEWWSLCIEGPTCSAHMNETRAFECPHADVMDCPEPDACESQRKIKAEPQPLTDEEKESIAVSGWMRRDAEAISLTDEEIANITRLVSETLGIGEQLVICQFFPRLLAERAVMVAQREASANYIRDGIKEIRRLKAGLQKTKDGVYVVPGMVLWFEADTGDIASAAALQFVADNYDSVLTPYGWRLLGDCYSTREAAEKAAQLEQPQCAECLQPQSVLMEEPMRSGTMKSRGNVCPACYEKIEAIEAAAQAERESDA